MNKDDQKPSFSPGGGKFLSREAMDRLARLNRAKLATKLTTADQLAAPSGKGQGGAKAAAGSHKGKVSKPADLAALCPGRVLEGAEGMCYLVDGPMHKFAEELGDVEKEYRRTFLGGGINATVEELHESVRPLLAAPVESIVCLDIETCGMAGMQVFEIGLLRWHQGGVWLEQFVARDYAEEAALLARAWEMVDQAEVLVTFNGVTFDVPFIQDRSAASGLGARRLRARHVDLLHEARRRWRKMLPNCRLQTLERFLCGRLRTGDIPGELIPGVYHEFVRTGDARQMERVLYHNAHDLITLAELMVMVLQNRDGDLT
jgi:uncharacterized protein YprB with RNaseH-like and TPR domain